MALARIEQCRMNKYISSSSRQYFAFNVWDFASAKAIIDAAAKSECPIILQTSMKAFSKLDKNEFRTFVTQYSKQKKVNVYLHLDHCKRRELFEDAISAGWDSVMIDASERPLLENIQITNEICRMAHNHNVLVEAEIGHIAGVEDGEEITQGGIADIKDVDRFIKETDIDSLAVAIGTAHGLYKGKPTLHYELLEKTGKISNIPLVIHGGTGLSDDMFKKLFSYPNVKKINISTDVKQAYRAGLCLSQNEKLLEKSGFDPLKVVANIHDCIEQMALHYLNLQKQGVCYE